MRAERSPERLHFTECSYNVTAVMTSYCTETNIQEIVLYVIYDTWTGPGHSENIRREWK